MRPGPRRSLTHAEILDAAFELLEAKGFDAVSVRGVAGALGLTPTAMYTYYASKDALLRGMVEQVLGRLPTEETTHPDDARDDPRARVLALADALRALLVDRPGAVGLLFATPLDGPNARRLDERLLEAFTDAGLDLVDAGRASHAMRAHVLGAVAFDAAEVELSRAPLPVPKAAVASSAPLWDDAEPFPLADRARELGDDASARFAWGVERLLDGLLAETSAG